MWMVTFADLMAIMLTFFVLLLTMSIIDTRKFQDAIISLQGTFGDPIPSLERISAGYVIGDMLSPPSVDPTLPEPFYEESGQERDDMLEPERVMLDLVEPLYEELAEALAEEIARGEIEIERSELQILIRFQQEISFQSGDATLQPSFLPILDTIGNALKDLEGSIIVIGHTDDRPISTVRFRSNWDLSTARAASVVHYLTESHPLKASRIIAAGRADTQPLVMNDSAANRAINRRVEVTIRPFDVLDAERDPNGADTDPLI